MKLFLSKKQLIIIIVILSILFIIGWFIYHALISRQKQYFSHSNGRIEATEIFIATKLAGRIEQIKVSEGELVKEHDVLVQMDTATLQAQLAEANAQLEKAYSNQTAAQAATQLRESELIAAQATVNQYISEYQAHANRYQRSEQLVRKRALSLQQRDDDRASAKSAEAMVNSAKAKLASAESALAGAKADEIAAHSSIKAAQATVARIQADINDSELKAPKSGRIQYRIAQPGEVLAAGGRVLNLIDTRDVYMTLFLPTEVVGKLNLGDAARIILDAWPNQVLPAYISYIDNVAQFTPKSVETADERQKLTFRVKLHLDKTFLTQHADRFKTGLPGVAWVKLDPAHDWLPELTVTPSS